MFWVLSSRGLAPVDVDVEAETRVRLIRAGNLPTKGLGLLHYGHLSFPLSLECRVAKTQLLRERDKNKERNKNTHISLLF